MERIKPFRFWCQKVMPLVYDESLSYYELLCKVVTRLNTTTGVVNELGENVSDMVTKFNELKEYVENTITETVDEEVDKKLDEYFAEHFFVKSINGLSGNVTITANDVGAAKNNYGASMAGKILAIGLNGEVIPVDAGASGVSSVNGKTGDVELSAVDVGAAKNNYGASMAGKILAIGVSGEVIPVDAEPSGVSSVNGKTGDVELSAVDVGAVKEFFGEDYAGEVLLISPDGSVTSGAIDTDAIEAGSITLQKLANVGSENAGKVFKINSNGDVALGDGGGGGTGGAVESVNGKTGVVVLNAEDVGALSSDVEELPNPFKITFNGAVSAEYDGSQAVTVTIPQGGGGAVESVNGKSGIVVLNARDVGAVESVNGKTGIVALNAEDVGALAEVPDTYRTSAEQDEIDEALSNRINSIELAKFPNAVIVGNPLINGSSVSLFSDNNYMVFPFIVDVRGYPFTIDFCFRTNSDVITQQNIMDSKFGIALAVANGQSIVALSSTGESWDICNVYGNYQFSPNTVYYGRVSWNGQAYSTAFSTDGTSYNTDMTVKSGLGLFPTTVYIGGSPNIFGEGSAHPFFGTIDMQYAKLTVAGLEVWRGMSDPAVASRANVSLSNLDAQGLAKFDAKNIKYTETKSVYDKLSEMGTAITNANKKINALDTGTVKTAQGSEKAGQFLVVGSDGNVTTQSFATWNGGNY